MEAPRGSSRILKIRDEPLNPSVFFRQRIRRGGPWRTFSINPVNPVNPVKHPSLQHSPERRSGISVERQYYVSYRTADVQNIVLKVEVDKESGWLVAHWNDPRPKHGGITTQAKNLREKWWMRQFRKRQLY